MSQLAQAATEVSMIMRASPRLAAQMGRLASLASQVESTFRQQRAAVDREAEWQRVHSYIADVLKDTHVLYAKLARLEGDFAGEELVRLERISEAVLTLGNELSAFSKAFYEGKYDMAQTDLAYGQKSQEEAPSIPEEPLIPLAPEAPEEAAEELFEEGEQAGQQGEEQAEEAQQ